MKCETCASQRWLLYAPRWKDDKIAADWRPFDRGTWSFLSPAVLASCLATGTLKACPTCNAGALAPWARSWTNESPAMASKAEGAPF